MTIIKIKKVRKNVTIIVELGTLNVFVGRRRKVKKENANVGQEGNNKTREIGFMSFCHTTIMKMKVILLNMIMICTFFYE